MYKLHLLGAGLMGPAPAPWEFVDWKDTVQSAEHLEEWAGSTG